MTAAGRFGPVAAFRPAATRPSGRRRLLPADAGPLTDRRATARLAQAPFEHDRRDRHESAENGALDPTNDPAHTPSVTPRLAFAYMRIVVGTDDELELAQAVIEDLRSRGHEVRVLDSEQWPEVARKVGQAVAGGEAEQGVLFCWTGTGTSMAANKVPGVRAALAWDPWIAEGARRWNDANVLVISLKRTDEATARAILDAWFAVERPDPDEAENIGLLKKLDLDRNS